VLVIIGNAVVVVVNLEKITNKKRTVVMATVQSKRMAIGLTVPSNMMVIGKREVVIISPTKARKQMKLMMVGEVFPGIVLLLETQMFLAMMMFLLRALPILAGVRTMQVKSGKLLYVIMRWKWKGAIVVQKQKQPALILHVLLFAQLLPTNCKVFLLPRLRVYNKCHSCIASFFSKA
jgi:hypothetical protein